jgi:uncharacterized Zn-binding protein involved in type VI secretion
MATGACRSGDEDSYGDLVTGPCCATVLIDDLPASIVGDIISGQTMLGSVTVGSPSVFYENVAANRIGSTCAGESLELGTPLSSVMATGSTTVLVP